MTNQFTDEQIDAAAKAINLAGWTYQGEHEPGEYCKDCRECCLPVARVVLEAAAGVAPQAESADHEKLIARLTGSVNPLSVTCGECGSKPGKRCYGNGEMRRPHPSREARAERELRIEAADALAAQVQPSSTVDEAALIREAKAEAWDDAVAMVSDEEHALVHSGWGTVVSKLTIIKALRARAAEYREGAEA